MQKYLSIIALLPLLLISCSSSSDNQMSTIAKKPFYNSSFVEVDNMAIHYRVWVPNSSPNPTPLFFIHGFGGSTEDWRNQFDFFQSKGFFIVAVDIPSFGYSDRSIVETSRDIRADWFWKLISSIENNYNLSKCWILVGYSLGSTIAAGMAKIRPEKTAALILASGPGDDPQHGKQLAQIAGVYLPPIWPFTSIAESALRSNFTKKENLSKNLTKIFNREPTDEEIEIYMRPWLVPWTAYSVAHNSILGLKVDQRIPPFSINVPLLFIWGTNDKIIPLSACANLPYYLTDEQISAIHNDPNDSGAQKYDILLVDDGEFQLVDNAGHGMILTHSNIVNQIIFDYLDRNHFCTK